MCEVDVQKRNKVFVQVGGCLGGTRCCFFESAISMELVYNARNLLTLCDRHDDSLKRDFR